MNFLITLINEKTLNNPFEVYALDTNHIEVIDSLDITSEELDDFSIDINIRVHMKLPRQQYLFLLVGKV